MSGSIPDYHLIGGEFQARGSPLLTWKDNMSSRQDYMDIMLNRTKNRHVFTEKQSHVEPPILNKLPETDPCENRITHQAPSNVRGTLIQLAEACEYIIGPRSKDVEKAIGADIVRLITGPVHGHATNIEAIATIARVLIYILDQSETILTHVSQGYSMPRLNKEGKS